MADPTKQIGPPGKAATSAATPSRPSLNIDTAPTLLPTPAAGYAGLGSPMSPITRDLSPGESPIQESGPGLAIFPGPITRIAVKDPNTLSSAEFVTHKSIDGLYDILERQAAAIERMAEAKAFVTARGAKAGTFTPEESEISRKILRNYDGLVKEQLEAYGGDLKKRTPADKLTANAGEKMYQQATEFQAKLIDAAPLDESSNPGEGEAAPDVKGLEQLMNQFSQTGVRVFYQGVVKLYIPNDKGKAKSKKSAGKAVELTDALNTIISLTTVEPGKTILQDAHDEYMEGKKKYTRAKELLQQANAFKAELKNDVDAQGSGEGNAKEVVDDLESLNDDDLLRVWRILEGKEDAPSLHEPAKKSTARGGSGAGSTRGAPRRGRTASRGGGRAGAAVGTGAGHKRRREDDDDDMEDNEADGEEDEENGEEYEEEDEAEDEDEIPVVPAGRKAKKARVAA